MADQNEVWLTMWIDGAPYEDTVDRVLSLEINERADQASSFHLSLDLASAQGDWDLLADGRFALLHSVTIELGISPVDATGPAQRAVIFQGYITAVEPRFGETRVPESSLELYGLDASCLMHFEERTVAWSDKSDADIVKTIYESYGFSTEIVQTTPVRTSTRGPLVQRTTDAEFIRLLARRNGCEAYVERTPDAPVNPGATSGKEIVGHFHPPKVGTPSQPVLELVPHDVPSLIELTARWESHHPTVVMAKHIDENTRRIKSKDFDTPRFARMGSTSRADILKKRLAEILPAPSPQATGVKMRQFVDVPYDAQELENLAWADFQEADWLAVATGVVQGMRYPQVLRARRPVDLSGAGALLDGTWYVRGARHRWLREAHTKRYEVDVDLVRNALSGVG